MQTLTELDLPHLAIADSAFADDPFPQFEAARERHPWLAKSDLGYVVHEYRAMHDLRIQDEKLSKALDKTIEILGLHDDSPLRRWLAEELFSGPVEMHRRIRGLLAKSFTPRHANQMRPLMRQTITRLLEEWVPRETFDFEVFASWFPVTIMFDMLRAPLERLAASRSDLETMGLLFSLNRNLVPALEAAFIRIDELAQDIIAAGRFNERQDQPPDLMDALVAASASGGISERQFADVIISLIVAANDSTKNVLTLIMYSLISRPDVYRRCAVDYDYCHRVVEEALRYQSTATGLVVVLEDIIYRDVLLPKGTVLLFPYSIAGRDPAAFPDGEIFDPDRPIDTNHRHIAFGLGERMCIGQFIARAELQEGLHLIAQRIHEPKQAGKITWRPFPGIWGPSSLPVTFTPG